MINSKCSIKIYLKDVIIYLFFIAIIVLIGYQDFKKIDEGHFLDELSSFIGIVVVILFGIIGLFEFAYDNGLFLLVPTTFINFKNKKSKELVSYSIDKFLKEELQLFSLYDKERIAFFLSQLGISQSEFESIKRHLLSIKLMPLKNIDDAKDKLKEIIYSCNGNDYVIIDQEKCESHKLVYKKVRYFIDLTNIMFIKDYSDEIVDCLIMLIKESISNELDDINRIIIPYNSNRLLGFYTGEKIGKSIINVTKTPYIYEDQKWEGRFDNRKNNAIVIHDVLVTGEQVINSINIVNKQCEINYIFCLVNRIGYTGKEMLEKSGYKVFSLLDISDDEISKELKKNGKV